MISISKSASRCGLISKIRVNYWKGARKIERKDERKEERIIIRKKGRHVKERKEGM